MSLFDETEERRLRLQRDRLLLNSGLCEFVPQDCLMVEEKEAGRVPCPSCNQENLHIIRVIINAGGRITIVDSRGTHMDVGEPDGRGVSVKIVYWCEHCHDEVSQKQHFHKGSTLLSHIIVKDSNLVRRIPDDIWRD